MSTSIIVYNAKLENGSVYRKKLSHVMTNDGDNALLINEEQEHLDYSQDSFRTKLIQFLKFLGPGVLISVGYIDPGNCM